MGSREWESHGLPGSLCGVCTFLVEDTLHEKGLFRCPEPSVPEVESTKVGGRSDPALRLRYAGAEGDLEARTTSSHKSVVLERSCL